MWLILFVFADGWCNSQPLLSLSPCPPSLLETKSSQVFRKWSGFWFGTKELPHGSVGILTEVGTTQQWKWKYHFTLLGELSWHLSWTFPSQWWEGWERLAQGKGQLLSEAVPTVCWACSYTLAHISQSSVCFRVC